MEKYQIGTILTNRIAECGFTQEKFSEIADIPLSTLKKYMSGKTAYNYIVLDKLSKTLNCSYDYLLGYSCSPEREYHEIKEQTLLSDESIEILCNWAKKSEEDEICDYISQLLDEIICNKHFLISMLIYCATNKVLRKAEKDKMEEFIKLVMANNKSEMTQEYMYGATDKFLLVSLVQDIESIRHKMSPELLEFMRKDINKLNKSLEP